MTAHPSMEGFLAFCESKPEGEKYEYIDSWQCACAQYSKTLGMTIVDAEVPEWRCLFNRGDPLWQDADDHAAEASRHTFGSLARRIRKHIEEGE